ncbi:MAG: Short-chain dehydrogenase [Pseudolabrys sp.]|jgi:short-subunit dehydrogenase|nr:Short-chain dehydrogenase [Pseudolabrys sp.]
MPLRPVTLITGASSGIGAELARVFAANGHALALVARRRDRLEALAGEIAAQGKDRPLVIVVDLAAPDAVETIRGALAAHSVEPQYVVNNAGYGIAGPAARRALGDQLGVIDVNMRALTALSLAFVDSLARHRGGILNVGSMAGFLPGPGMAVYYASKAYVRSFSDALRRELKPRGIRVTHLAPGPVPTEFGERAGTRSVRVPELLTQNADHVAELGYRGLVAGKALVVPGALNRMLVALVRFVPAGLLAAAVGRRQSRRGAVAELRKGP